MDAGRRVHAVYAPVSNQHTLTARHAPAFLIYHWDATYNRIGRPSARLERSGDEEIWIDPSRPVIYHQTREFSTPKGIYTNLIYRVHFSEVPHSLIPFHLTAGKNVGILVIITLDRKQRPLLVTTVGTCGCYAAVVPTEFLPAHCYPLGWDRMPQAVYGETLPSILRYRHLKSPRLLVHVRPALHRIMDLEYTPQADLPRRGPYKIIRAPLEPVASLKALPLNGRTTSLYYPNWPLKGHVKGSIKPWETLFMSVISLDFFVGSDKVYADSRISGNPFYTSLKPWNRGKSDLWQFARFLRYNGWRL
jgi:hypothetical protein